MIIIIMITHAGRQLSPDREDSPPMGSSSPAKPEMDSSSAKSPTSNVSEDANKREGEDANRSHSPERARLEIQHLIEKEDFSSEVSDPAQENTPQRRKSKAEMKEYVLPREGASDSPTKVFKKVEEDLEAMFSEKSSDIKAAEVTKAGDFQKVENDLEAMFGGLDEDKEKEKVAEKSPELEKKKRGRKAKAAKAPEQDDDEDAKPVEQSNPVNSGRATSKRKSAQNAEMRMKDDMDDILDQIINRKKPKKISSSSAHHSIDETPPGGEETSIEAEASSKVEAQETKAEKLTRTKSKEESMPAQPDLVPKYKKSELISSKDETKNSDTDNIFDFQDSEDDSSGSRQKPKDKKPKSTFEGIQSKKLQPKERSSKIKLKQGRHGKIATEVSPEKPTELKFTKPMEKKVAEDFSKDKITKREASDAQLISEKSKSEINSDEKVKSHAERRSRRSKGDVKENSETSLSPKDSTQPSLILDKDKEKDKDKNKDKDKDKDSTQPSLILDTRRSGKRESTDSILVKEEEIEARRSRQRKWEDLDKGKQDLDKGKQDLDKGKQDLDKGKPAEKDGLTTNKGKASKSAESIMLEGSEEIKRIFDESLKNKKDPKAEDTKQDNSTEPESKEAPVSPKVRGRLGRRGRASDPGAEPQAEHVEETKPELAQEVRSSRRSRGGDVVAEASVETSTESQTSRASRRNKVAEVVTGRESAAAQEPAEGGGRASRRSRGQEIAPTVESESAGKATGKGTDGKGKMVAAVAAEKEKVEEVTRETVEPEDSPSSNADESKQQPARKLEIKINKLDLQQEPKSSEGSKVDLGGLMSKYPGLVLAASKDTKEAQGSPTEPEGRRSRRNRRSSELSSTHKDEIGGSQDSEFSGRGRKRKLSSEPNQLHLPAGIEVVRIEDSTPEKIPSETPTERPTAAVRRRSRRGSDGFNEDPIIQREVEDSIHIDGLERVADTSNLDSANVSANQSKFHI